MNALANAEVGKFFKAHFIASHQKIGNFTIDGNRKQGGNVASYFCTADGCVLHVVAGPVSAETLLREARWVVETWKAAAKATAECDTFLVVGTSAVVYPAAGLIDAAREAGASVIEVNPEATFASHRGGVGLRGPSGVILPQLVQRLV